LLWRGFKSTFLPSSFFLLPSSFFLLPSLVTHRDFINYYVRDCKKLIKAKTANFQTKAEQIFRIDFIASPGRHSTNYESAQYSLAVQKLFVKSQVTSTKFSLNALLAADCTANMMNQNVQNLLKTLALDCLV
jgi:hypothetical protein